MIPINLQVPLKKSNEFNSKTKDDILFSVRKAKTNNLTIKYERKKYELKTHKIGIRYKNAIKKGIKGIKSDMEAT